MISNEILYGRMLRGIVMTFILWVSTVAGAQEIKVQELSNTPGLELQHGVVYTVKSNMNITSQKVGQAGLTVTRGSTVTIYIAKGKTLTVKGHDGNGRSAATPGIYVPQGATLIVTGEGSLVATGGNAGRGSNGENGVGAWLDWHQNKGYGGRGGTGGAGGGGAAPGIGAVGGEGAPAKAGPDGNTRSCNGNDFDGNGNGGYTSNQGANGQDAGNVYMLGTVVVTTNKGIATGAAASPGGDYGGSATDAGSGWWNNYTSGGGGPGGGGGSGYAANCGIGGGAPGGQSGTTGGSGGTMKNSSGRDHIKGAGGRGGYGGVNGLNSDKGPTSAYGKSGGAGGGNTNNTAKHGGNGKVYVASTARDNGSDRPSEKTWSMPSIIGVKCYLDANGGSTRMSETTMYYGTRPDKVVIPSNGNKYFDGYYTERNGGEQVFDATGNSTGLNTRSKSFTVYARWYDGYADFGSLITKTGYKATAKTKVMLVRKDKTDNVTPSAGSEVTFSGELKSVGIYEDGKLVRHYVLAHKDNKVYLFEEIKTRAYLLCENYGSNSYPKDYTGGNCNHALMGGRSAFHTISSGKNPDDSSYDLKKCYLCAVEKQVPTDKDYVELTGGNYINTEYAVKANSSIFTRMQYSKPSSEQVNTSSLYTKEAEGSNKIPLTPYWHYGGTHVLYKRDIFKGAGYITEISYEPVPGQNVSAFKTKKKVYMMMTNKEQLSSKTPERVNFFTLVFDGEITEASNAKTVIKLQTPFKYDGSSNLIVAIFKPEGDYKSLKYRMSETGEIMSLYRYSDNSSQDGNPEYIDNYSIATQIPYTTFTLQTGIEQVPFGTKDGSNQFVMNMGYSESEGYFNTFMNCGSETYGKEGETVLYPEIDYDVLAMKDGLMVSETELATKSVIEETWSAASNCGAQPLYIGSANVDGSAMRGMTGRIYDFTIMEDGKPVHKYIPAMYNGKAGLYDEVMDTTIIFENKGTNAAKAHIHDKRCAHRYRITRKNGVEERHCQVCDYLPEKTYYSDITFHGGATDVDGMMKPQTIDREGNLTKNSFSRPMYVFKGWSKTEGSNRVDYSNQAYIKPTAEDCGDKHLYAVWDECYVVRTDTIAIPANNIVDSVCTEDRSMERTGMATRRPITIKRFEYYRELPAGTEWGTVCLPIALASNDTVTYYTKARVKGNQLILTPASEVAPNSPCIYRVKKGVKNLRLEGTQAHFDGKIENSVSGEIGGLEIVGTYQDLQIDCSGEGKDCYAINGNKFYHVESSVDVTPFRAYLKAPAGTASARELIIVEDGETSAEAISDYERMSDGKYLKDGKVVIYNGGEKYDINGRRNK